MVRVRVRVRVEADEEAEETMRDPYTGWWQGKRMDVVSCAWLAHAQLEL